MSVESFNAIFRGGWAHRGGAADPMLRPQHAIDLRADPERDDVRGRVGRSKSAPTVSASNGLDQRLGPARRFGFRAPRDGASAKSDLRQRTIVKIHYFGHAGGGATALKAHARYLERESAQLQRNASGPGRDAEASHATPTRHAAYLARDGRGEFYDALDHGVDGPARIALWAREDRRHFRIILAAEGGTEIGDLRSYVRDVMGRSEKLLGTRLEWVAVDHWDTDNPHSHVVLRGRRSDGRVLVLPRDFVKHGMRSAARDAATERLGPRSPADERRALLREARAHRPSRLDHALAATIALDGALRIADIKAPQPAFERALKERARELQRLGLATAKRRNVLTFAPDWRARLKAMELHLDVRKRLMQGVTRTAARSTPSNLPGITR